MVLIGTIKWCRWRSGKNVVGMSANGDIGMNREYAMQMFRSTQYDFILLGISPFRSPTLTSRTVL